MAQKIYQKERPAIEDTLPLTLQQQQRYAMNGQLASYYWLNFNQLTEINLKEKLLQLMQSHDILRTRFVEPQGFTNLRQYVDELVLEWHQLPESTGEWQNIRKNIEKVALDNFYESPSHLSASYIRCKNTSGELSNYILLIGSSLALDDGSISRIHRYLTSDEIETAEMQYGDYGEWFSQLQEDEDADEATHYWQSFDFDNFPSLVLHEREGTSITDLKPDNQQTSVNYSLPSTIAKLLEEKATELETEPQFIILSIWAALLNRLSSFNTLYLHYYHDSRDNYEELDEVLGVFAQALPVPFYDINSVSLKQCVTGLSTLLDEHNEYQEYVGKISPANKVGFQYQQQQSGVVASSDYIHNSSDLFLHCSISSTEHSSGQLQLHFNPSLYSSNAMERALRHYCLLLEQALLSADKPLIQLPCLLEDEKNTQTFIEHSAVTSEQSKDNILLDSIYHHVVQTPKATAVRCNNTIYNYHELWEISDKIAANLQSLGAKPETIVALCLPREANFLIGLLAVLKTGAAYLPIDPALPKLRIAHILDDAKPVVVISSDTKELGNVDTIKEACTIKPQPINWSQLLKNNTPLKPVNFANNQLAYVLYTSGSSGLPKGVQVTYQAIMHYSTAAISALVLPKQGSYGLISSLMADLGNTVLFPAWLQGGTLHLLSQDMATDGQRFAQYHQKFPIDCLKIVPSHFAALLNGNTAALLPKHSLIFGGEKIDNALLNTLRHYQQKNLMSCRVYNHYGPTETTVGVLWRDINLDMETIEAASLEHCLGENQVYLLDESLNPVITGQPAELYIAGPNVTRGYLNNPAKTAEHYLANPFAKSGQRMYRTGDLAMRTAHNTLQIIGRSDKQIKIRGFRLDLNEIETLLNHFEGVEQASIHVEGSGEQAKIVGFYIEQANKTVEQKKALAWLSDNLPEYMVPSQLWCIDAFPLNANGKLDIHALFAWAHEQKNKQYIAPQNDMEVAINCIWQEILGIDTISSDDNFFDIGGHSLAAIKVVARLRESLGRELPTNVIFQAQTIQALATFVENNTAVQHLQEISAPINSDKTVPTLVLMHSHGGHLHYYQKIIDALKEDITIFGLYPDKKLLRSTKPESINQLLKSYHQHLLPLKNTPITLLGWSLAARQVVVLAEYLIKQGFTIHSLSLVDYNPKEQLKNKDNAIAQLMDDVKYYIEDNIRDHQGKFNESIWNALESSLLDHATNDYEEGLEYLLQRPELQTVIGSDAPVKWMAEWIGQRWALKSLFYAADIPTVSTPLWVWHSSKNTAALNDWQTYTQQTVTGYTIDADHYSILQSPQFIEQLSAHMLPEKIDTSSSKENMEINNKVKNDTEITTA